MRSDMQGSRGIRSALVMPSPPSPNGVLLVQLARQAGCAAISVAVQDTWRIVPPCVCIPLYCGYASRIAFPQKTKATRLWTLFCGTTRPIHRLLWNRTKSITSWLLVRQQSFSSRSGGSRHMLLYSFSCLLQAFSAFFFDNGRFFL